MAKELIKKSLPTLYLSARANPDQVRIDLWNGLYQAAERLETRKAKGSDTAELEAYITSHLKAVRPMERFWIFPGSRNIERLEQRLARRDYDLLAEDMRVLVRNLSQYGDRAGIYGDLDELVKAGSYISRLPHYFTVLIVDDTIYSPESAIRRAREIRQPGDDFIYEVLFVDSLEHALTAALFNYDIQACIISQDFPLRAKSGDSVKWVKHLVEECEAKEQSAGGFIHRGAMLAEYLRELRPTLNLYLLTTEAATNIGEITYKLFDRVFYSFENLMELHMTLLEGVRDRYRTPLFDALKRYAERPIGNFHALPIARGNSIFNSKWIRDMGEFYGRNIFMAETSSTSGGLDSLLEPTGTIMEAQKKAAQVWGAQHTFFATNGTSTSNKIVVQALTKPGDIVLIDRNCHKSHHYGLILGGAHPLYLDAYPLEPYAMYGGVSLRTIKKTLLELKKAGRLDNVKMLLLTNCTFDGLTYNPQRVMEEVLAIKPDIVFLWDEAWYAFANFHPLARRRIAMYSARVLSERYASDAYRAEYAAYKSKMDRLNPDDDSTYLDNRLMPDPDKVRIRVYATQSTHKSLSALRQGSMIHIYDQDFERLSAETFLEAYFTHTSTSPNYQIVASLDLARRQVDLEGYAMVSEAYQIALYMRERVKTDSLLSKYIRILSPEEMIPAEFRPSGFQSFTHELTTEYVEKMRKAWIEDEFTLDPTRLTLYIADTGFNGSQFKNDVLMNRFGIQINKTSINSILMIFTIGVTWSALDYLIDSLKQFAESLDRQQAGAGPAEQSIFKNKVSRLTTGLPPLPDFSHFHPAFRPDMMSAEGDMRGAYFMNYTEENREYVKLPDAVRMVKEGRSLVSTNLVVPYPPGFPVLVPGQVISPEILDFMEKLDVKEIHGYNAAAGLSVFTDKALDEYAQRTGRTGTAAKEAGRKRRKS
jgi:arginine decarboxylase